MRLTTIRCATDLAASALLAFVVLGWPAMTQADELVRCSAFTQDQPAAPEPRENPHALKRFQLINDLVKSHPYRVLFLGDSLTERWAEVPEDQRIWDRYFHPLDALNAGIDGDRTEHLLWRIEHGNLENQRPGAVVLLIGTNDLGHGRRPEEAAEGVRRILIEVRKKLPETLILLEALWPRSDLSRLSAGIQPVNKRIGQCDDGANVRFIDPGSHLLNYQGRLPRDLAPDGLHPSPQGYEKISPLIAAALRAELTVR